MQQIYDGNAVAIALAVHSKTRPLANMLRRIRDLASIHADLERVSRLIAGIENSMATEEDTEREIEITTETSDFHAAYAHAAILLYVRATSKNDNRARFDVRKYYDNVEKEAHRQLILVRNGAVAHFGNEEHGAASWNDNKIYLMRDFVTGELHVSPNQIQYNFRGDTLGHLRRLLPKAMAGLAKDIDHAYETFFDEARRNFEDFNLALAKNITTIDKRDDETAKWIPPHLRR